MKNIRLVTIAGLFLCVVVSCPASAADVPQSLHTPAGVVAVRNAKMSVCGDDYTLSCQAIEVNGNVLARDSHAWIDAVFPTTKTPVLISVETDTGGNACCWNYYILDVSQSSPILIKNFRFGKQISYSEHGVTFVSPTDKATELGDLISGLYSYSLGSGKPVLIREFPVYSTTPLNQKKYASDVLGDPSLRAPILKIVGQKHFAQYRLDFGVTRAPTIIQDRFITGDGCMPHDCPDHWGFFVIDRVKNLAWCIEYDEDISVPRETQRIKLRGILTDDDIVPRKLISDYLGSVGISWNQLTPVALPPDVAKLYGPLQREKRQEGRFVGHD